MSFSEEWESIYGRGEQHTRWPWSDLVSLVCTYIPEKSSHRRVLELGCGTGANILFFLESGALYHAIEGSEAAVAVLHKRYPELRSTVAVGDFTQSFLHSGPFDLIVDRASVTHNSTHAIQQTLALAWENLAPGGHYIGVDWFSDRHSDRSMGVSVDDENTYHRFSDGQFRTCGKVHFSNESHLRGLFSAFEIRWLAEKTSMCIEPSPNHLFAAFDIVARKSL